MLKDKPGKCREGCVLKRDQGLIKQRDGDRPIVDRLRGPEIEEPILSVEKPLARNIQLLKDVQEIIALVLRVTVPMMRLLK